MESGNFEKVFAQRITAFFSECGYIEFDDETAPLVCPLPQMLKVGLERVVNAEDIDLEADQLVELLDSAIDPDLN
jgi:hypothetical protein